MGVPIRCRCPWRAASHRPVFPDTQRSPDPYGGDLLPFDKLVTDVFDTRRYSATYGTSMRPSGRLYASDVEEAADPRIPAPAFSRLSEPLSDILVGVGGASRGIWRMLSLMGWPTVLSSGIWCSRVATRPKESRLFDGASERYLLRGACAKPHGVLGHAKPR